MPKSIKCLDVGVQCDFEARAETEPELMKKVAEHAKNAHGITQDPPRSFWRKSKRRSRTCSHDDPL